MRKLSTLLFLSLASLVGYSQTDWVNLMDFQIDGNEVSFIMPTYNTQNYNVNGNSVGSIAGDYVVQVESVRLTSSNPSITFDCGQCIFDSEATNTERSFTVTGSGFFNVLVEMSGRIDITGYVDFPGGIDVLGNTLTAFNFQSQALESVNTTSVGGIDALTFNVGQNYPNPFTNTTTVEFSSPKSGTIDFSVFDISGKLVESSEFEAETGVNKVEVGKTLSSGVYTLVATSENRSQSIRLVKY